MEKEKTTKYFEQDFAESFAGTATAVPRRNYKDRLFRMVFQEKKDLLSLYNAINGTQYTNEADIEIVTLENAIYMNMKNDLAFLLDFELNLYEHQSTFSPNMPLRDLFYIAKELQKLVKSDMLYRSKLVQIPTPRFLVLYNGTDEQPESRVLKLSDAFQKKMGEPELELKVTMLNINMGKNKEIMEQCRKLKEYMLYVERVRNYAKEKPIKDAVEQAVTECIKEGILSDFLMKYRKEAIAVCIFEYNEEEALKYIREDEYSLGVQDGIEQGIERGIEQGIKKGIERGQECGLARGIIEMGLEFGLDRDAILKQLQAKLSIEPEKAEEYLQRFEEKQV